MHPDPNCWHEAGHALIAWLLGGDVRLVTLESEFDDHDGHVEIAWPGDLPPDRLARHSAMVAIAGPLAELAFRGVDDLEDPDVLSAWRRDWSEFERCVANLESEPSHDETGRAIVAEVRATLDDFETAERLARVADMLAAHGSLDRTLFEDAVA